MSESGTRELAPDEQLPRSVDACGDGRAALGYDQNPSPRGPPPGDDTDASGPERRHLHRAAVRGGGALARSRASPRSSTAEFKTGGEVFTQTVRAGQIHLALNFIGPPIVNIDERAPLVILAGVHAGCFRAVRNRSGCRRCGTSRGRRSGSQRRGRAMTRLPHRHALPTWASIRAWMSTGSLHPFAECRRRLLAEGKIDGYLGFRLRTAGAARKEGRARGRQQCRRPPLVPVLLLHDHREPGLRPPEPGGDEAGDARDPEDGRPLCAGTRAWRRKASWIRAGRKQYDYALQMMKDLPYGRWRDYSPEDTVRFYALRLREAGMIKSTPQKIIAEGTDWRFIDRAQARDEGVSVVPEVLELRRDDAPACVPARRRDRGTLSGQRGPTAAARARGSLSSVQRRRSLCRPVGTPG